MKKILHLIFLLVCGSQLLAQGYLDATASDPNQMGWMQGFPPKKDRTVSASDGSFFRFPALRYSVCHMRQFLPTTVVEAAPKNPYNFQVGMDPNIDRLTFTPWNTATPMTWEAALDANYTDGMLILHKGVVVYERYFGALTPVGVHAAMSVSKTFTGTLGALLVAEGVLDENATASQYVPELEGSAFGDASI